MAEGKRRLGYLLTLGFALGFMWTDIRPWYYILEWYETITRTVA